MTLGKARTFLAAISLAFGALTIACAKNDNQRRAEYDACSTAYKVGQRITECLIMKYNWPPGEANTVGFAYDEFLQGKMRDPAHTWPVSRTPLPHREEMKAVLRDLIIGEEAYWSDSIRYTKNAADIPWVQSLDSSYRLRIITAGARGWSAEVSHTRSSLRCGVFMGPPPADRGVAAANEGQVVCDSLPVSTR